MSQARITYHKLEVSTSGWHHAMLPRILTDLQFWTNCPISAQNPKMSSAWSDGQNWLRLCKKSRVACRNDDNYIRKSGTQYQAMDGAQVRQNAAKVRATMTVGDQNKTFRTSMVDSARHRAVQVTGSMSDRHRSAPHARRMSNPLKNNMISTL